MMMITLIVMEVKEDDANGNYKMIVMAMMLMVVVMTIAVIMLVMLLILMVESIMIKVDGCDNDGSDNGKDSFSRKSFKFDFVGISTLFNANLAFPDLTGFWRSSLAKMH